ncbi:DUF2939 domain-containing protein [Burkholderia sp. F1]|uniref:DUF2939 domain-containing protein n=1 Tax=Burkholderia sp. F1 TaxID=3366817 RepID=UPI003D7394EF
MKNKSLMVVAGAIVVLGAVTSYASPYMTLHSMRSDIIDKDADGFSSNVDFPAFRESLRAQLKTMMQNKLSSDPQLKQNPFADIGMMLGMSVANQIIDTMVTPAGVMHMMADASSKPPARSVDAPASTAASASESSRVDYSVRYRNWSTVAVTAQRDRNEPIEFIFKRNGLWSWKLSAVTLPPSVTSAD